MNKNLLSIYDIKMNKLGILNDNTENQAYSIQEDFSINQVSVLSFSIPYQSPKTKYLINEYIVKYKDKEYTIKNKTIKHDESGNKIISVECKGLEYSLTLKYNYELDLIGSLPSEIIDAILIDTEWKLKLNGIDNTVVNLRRTLQSKETSCFANLVKVCEIFSGYLKFNYDDRSIELIVIPPNRDIQFRVGKNIKELNLSYNTDSIITKLTSYGGNDLTTGNEINLLSINQNPDPNGTPIHHSYIEDFSYWLNLKDENGNYLVTQADIDADKNKYTTEMIWRSNDYLSSEMLYQDSIYKLSKISQPILTSTIKSIELMNMPLFFIQTPIVGEVITIFDKEIGINNMQVQVTKYRSNSDNEFDFDIEISTELEYKNIIYQIKQGSKYDNIGADNKGNTKGSTVNGSIIGGDIKYDINNGTFNLGSKFIYDGITLKVGSGEGHQMIVDANGNLTVPSATITGKLKANQIDAGEITGCTLQTASTISGQYISLKEQYLECKSLYGGVSFSPIKLGYENMGLFGTIPILQLTCHYLDNPITGALLHNGHSMRLISDMDASNSPSIDIDHITNTISLDATNVNINNTTIATQTWVQSQGYSTGTDLSDYYNQYQINIKMADNMDTIMTWVTDNFVHK